MSERVFSPVTSVASKAHTSFDSHLHLLEPADNLDPAHVAQEHYIAIQKSTRFSAYVHQCESQKSVDLSRVSRRLRYFEEHPTCPTFSPRLYNELSAEFSELSHDVDKRDFNSLAKQADPHNFQHSAFAGIASSTSL